MTESRTDEFLTVAEVAAMLKLNQQTIRKNWIDAGTLAALRVGRRVRVRRSDLDALIEHGSTGRRPYRVRLWRAFGMARFHRLRCQTIATNSKSGGSTSP